MIFFDLGSFQFTMDLFGHNPIVSRGASIQQVRLATTDESHLYPFLFVTIKENE
jgi:hypothetical protein